MQKEINRAGVRRRIRHRVRKRVTGTATRPRLAVFRSQQHIQVQAIDDQGGRTLAHASTQESEARKASGGASNIEAAKKVGSLIAERLKGAGIENVVFDRGGYLFHGRIKALADAAREGGVKF